MMPRSVPAVAILPHMDNAPASLLHQLKDILPRETIPGHGTWTVSFNDNIGILDKFCQSLAVFRILLKIEMSIPFSPVQVLMQARHIRYTRRGHTHHARAELS